MNLQQRINLLVELKGYILSKDPYWELVKYRASAENSWFTPEFLEKALAAIATQFLDPDKLNAWVKAYHLPEQRTQILNIGLVMAGNIPLVGFHDFLCVFISGHRQTIKPSSKDGLLIRHLVEKMVSLNSDASHCVSFADMLKNCDAYIATGSNNSARYFDYYFGKYPHIIRRNRTSVAILRGEESSKDLENLADDVYLYFGLGCRNVTKLYLPASYDFAPLLKAFSKYNYLMEQHKYKNNYDYQLTLQILNKKYYMTNGSIILIEQNELFSPISVLHFEYYSTTHGLLESVASNPNIQSAVGNENKAFGQAQRPGLQDYADGVDTLQFLLDL
jgi:hypothetical protein